MVQYNKLNLITVLGIEKESKCEIILGTFYSKEEAEQFCEQWGWNFDDGVNNYWMKIIEE